MIADKINLGLLLPNGGIQPIGEVKDFSTSLVSQSEDDTPPTVKNTFSFECSIESTPELKEFIEKTSRPLKDAQKLADRLNDLIEEYHAPGAPRSERRAIKREFDKIFRIYQKHCKKHNIQYTFQKQ